VTEPSIIDRLQAGVAPAFALLAGMQLDLFSRIGDGFSTPAVLAERLKVDPDRLMRLLNALTLAGLLRHEGGRYANSPEAAAFLNRHSPDFLGDQHDLLADLWAADLQTAQSIRTSKPAALHDFSHMDEAALSSFMRGLVPYSAATGRHLAEIFDLSKAVSIIDVGGGSGAAVAAMIEKSPGLHATLFELPSVAAAAKAILAALPGGDRVNIETGDILTAPPHGKYQLALLRAVLQVMSPEEAAVAVNHTCAALEPGGWIAISGSGILADDGLSPLGGVYMNLTLMNLYPNGTAHRFADHARWLEQSGCGPAEWLTLPSGAPLIRAQMR
jgi:hypothetical protein